MPVSLPLLALRVLPTRTAVVVLSRAYPDFERSEKQRYASLLTSRFYAAGPSRPARGIFKKVEVERNV
jgi:hypothetical protein